MTTAETEQTSAQPTFTHHAYGVDVEWFGEDGGMCARGHVPDNRFVAACNHLARSVGLKNIWDDRSASLDEVLAIVTRVWAMPIVPAGRDVDWAVYYGSDNTEDTPGAIPMTILLP
jgi:hypothetical protein